MVTADAPTKGCSSGGESLPNNSDEGRSSADSRETFNNSNRTHHYEQLHQHDTLKVDNSSLREIVEQDSSESVGIDPNNRYCVTPVSTVPSGGGGSDNGGRSGGNGGSGGNKNGGHPTRTRESLAAKRERKAAKTLAIITGVFVICWLPFFIIALLMPICGEVWPSICAPPQIVFSTFLWLGYVNSMLNPIIYTIFSPDFQAAFKRMLLGKKSRTSKVYVVDKWWQVLNWLINYNCN